MSCWSAPDADMLLRNGSRESSQRRIDYFLVRLLKMMLITDEIP